MTTVKRKKYTMKKFSVGTISEPVKFEVDDDEFEAIPANRLPAGALVRYFEKIGDSKIFEAHEIFFKAVLTEESFKLFNDRLNSEEKPITINIMGDVAAWLLGDVYMQGEASAESKQ